MEFLILGCYKKFRSEQESLFLLLAPAPGSHSWADGCKQFVSAVLCKRSSCFSKPGSLWVKACPQARTAPPALLGAAPISRLPGSRSRPFTPCWASVWSLGAFPPALSCPWQSVLHSATRLRATPASGLLTPRLLDETFFKAASTSPLLPSPLPCFSSGCLPVSLRI